MNSSRQCHSSPTSSASRHTSNELTQEWCIFMKTVYKNKITRAHTFTLSILYPTYLIQRKTRQIRNPTENPAPIIIHVYFLSHNARLCPFRWQITRQQRSDRSNDLWYNVRKFQEGVVLGEESRDVNFVIPVRCMMWSTD